MSAVNIYFKSMLAYIEEIGVDKAEYVMGEKPFCEDRIGISRWF